MTIPQAFQIAVQHHHAGRLAEAEALCRQILAAQPNHADALHFLGVLAHEAGHHGLAVELIRKSIVFNPDNSLTYFNLGEACRSLGQLDEAVTAYRRALELEPDCPEAHNNLGNALRARGQHDEAVVAFLRALQLKPDVPEVHYNLGNTLRERGQLDEAVAAFRRALQLKPEFPEAHNDLGGALMDRGQLDEAISAFHQALGLKHDYPEAYNNLGDALRKGCQLDEAVAALRQALELKPQFPDAHANLGVALFSQGQLDEAIAAFRDALQIEPEHAWVHSNLVFALHSHPGHDCRAVFEEQQRWNQQFSEPLKRLLQPHTNDRDPERPLRVGYVSPDFRDHPVGRYALPLFERHDREQFKILCYSGVVGADRMTESLRGLAGEWRNAVGIPDARLAEMIREDEVDILVDLAMHTAGNRLSVFARQPAPVQVAWLAYPGGTGLDCIGYRLTDAHIDPPGEAQASSAEEAVRLPGCWCCYDPVGETPEINPLPALSSEGVTFGSLNNFSKVHEGVLALWVRVLEAVKGSRLVMLCPEGRTQQRVRAFFHARGIAAERLELVRHSPRWDYLKLHHGIDLALDPFPCNGMTTTCDALWMGAPVLTLPGKTPVSRAGLSLLSAVGLGELVASSEEGYVRIAVELAGNLPRLADLRATLRSRMQASPLMDAPRFARNVEAAYRSMWKRWCAGGSPVHEVI